MKKNILFFVTSILIASQSQAQECCLEDSYCLDSTNLYAKIFVGANFLQDTEISNHKTEFDTGYILTGSIGYYWRDGLRLEAEYAFRKNDINKIHFFGHGCSQHGHFQTSSYMANLLWDVPLSSYGCTFWNITPFIGGGIGYDFQQLHSSNCHVVFNQKWHHFSWQLMTGLSYPIFCNTDLSLEYKFHQGGCHFNNHNVGVGLSYKFDL